MMQSVSTNPYRSPESSTASDQVVQEVTERGALLAWPWIFFLNLLVPSFLGFDFVSEHALLGTFAGVLVMGIVGAVVCYWMPSTGRAMIFGGLFTAITQFLPVLQILAGVIALQLAVKLGQAIDSDQIMHASTQLGGLILSVVTGGLLMTAALFFGYVFRAFGAMLSYRLPKKRKV